MITMDDLIRRVDELIKTGKKVLATRRERDNYSFVDSGLMAGFRSAALSFISSVYGNKPTYYEEFKSRTKSSGKNDVEAGIEILRAIRSEISGGWLFSMKGIITAEVFADFLEMAEHFLETGYKDPAAVMAGSVLEEHLRQLCIKTGIDIEREHDDRLIPVKADRLNADLAKEDGCSGYSKLDQKLVTAWLGIRNHAAHGEYDKYTDEQVKNMIAGITEFMARIAV